MTFHPPVIWHPGNRQYIPAGGAAELPGIVVRVNPTDLPIAGGGAETTTLPLTVQQSLGDHGIIPSNNSLLLAARSAYDVTINAIGTNNTDVAMNGNLSARLYIDGGNGGVGNFAYWQGFSILQSGSAARYRASYQGNYVRISEAAEALTFRVVPANAGSNCILNLVQLLITRHSHLP